ncbi:MAG: hypothetical protein JSV92_01035, partial [archaeon]
MVKKEKGTTIPFHLILTLIFVLLVIGLGIFSLESSAPKENINESIELAKNATKPKELEILEFCPGEKRRPPEPVAVALETVDFSGEGKIKCANIENMAVSCVVPGTHERGSGCLLDSFERTQWVSDGCEDPAKIIWDPLPVGYIARSNKGWNKFNFSDPDLNQEYYGKNKKFIYPCGGSIDKRDRINFCLFELIICLWNIECYMDWLYRVDSHEEEQKYSIGMKLEPNEEILVNSYFCDLWLTENINGGECSGADIKEKCGTSPSNSWGYCDGKSYNMGEGNFSVNAYVCCPPSGVVKGPAGHTVYDEAGNDLVEEWYWDSEKESCCLGKTCINKECEDVGGIWMYGRCWFVSNTIFHNCEYVCGKHEYSDGTEFQCKMPNWSRVP